MFVTLMNKVTHFPVIGNCLNTCSRIHVYSQILARCEGCEAHQQVSILIKKILLDFDPEYWSGS